jgi:hypothetical protein
VVKSNLTEVAFNMDPKELKPGKGEVVRNLTMNAKGGPSGPPLLIQAKAKDQRE